MTEPEPVIDRWFTTGPEPALIGRRCTKCGTYQFPPTGEWCPNPACDSMSMEDTELSRRGRVWSYTDAQYQPPAPFVPSTDAFEPFAIAAVELEAEAMVILGQVASGFGVGQLRVGTEVELVVEPIDASGALVWKWRPCSE
ncbi:MAG: OB-fold domain-containing protein [Actinomycetota bacterium]|nr:OB-fold domain-containing protein [Actinomycetota bacterium]